jgi:hypothetical protein
MIASYKKVKIFRSLVWLNLKRNSLPHIDNSSCLAIVEPVAEA